MSIDEQRLMMAASHYLPVNESRVPTGEIAPVAGTPFDFRKPKSLARAAALLASADRAHRGLRSLLGPSMQDAPVAAELFSPASGVRMRVKTNLPGLQVYGAYHLKTAYPGWHAVCIEPENFPDAPNHANFPSSILRPGETHRSFMSFDFSG